MHAYLIALILLVLFGCQSSPKTGKKTVADDQFNIMVCFLDIYDYDDCSNKVRLNSQREKARRTQSLKPLFVYYSNNSKIDFDEIFYATHPTVNSKGESVPYNMFSYIGEIPSHDGQGSILGFSHPKYTYILLWTAPDGFDTKQRQLGGKLSDFIECGIMTKPIVDKNGQKYYPLHDIQCP